MLIKPYIKGYIEIPDGKVDITDPCYDKDDVFRMNAVAIKQGRYRCRYWKGFKLEQKEKSEAQEEYRKYGFESAEEYIRAETRDIKNRVFILEIQHETANASIDGSDWKRIGNIAVDAGMAGFFLDKPDFDDKEWQKLCDYTLGVKAPVYLKRKLGFWSDSGYGDGCYEVYALKRNNEVLGLKIEF